MILLQVVKASAKFDNFEVLKLLRQRSAKVGYNTYVLYCQVLFSRMASTNASVNPESAYRVLADLFFFRKLPECA